MFIHIDFQISLIDKIHNQKERIYIPPSYEVHISEFLKHSSFVTAT